MQRETERSGYCLRRRISIEETPSSTMSFETLTSWEGISRSVEARPSMEASVAVEGGS